MVDIISRQAAVGESGCVERGQWIHEGIRVREGPVIFCFGMLSFSPLVFLVEAFRKVEKA